MKDQMINDFNIEGLSTSPPALEVLDMMIYIFGFIFAGTLIAVVYALRLKTLHCTATFILFIMHLLDFTRLCHADIWRVGTSSIDHHDFDISARSRALYVSQRGELKS